MRYPSEEADAYLAEHHKACDWAVANHDLIALRFLACLEPGDESWHLGIDDSSSDKHVDTIRTQQARTKIRQRKVVDIWHNAVTPVLRPLHWLLPPATPLRHPLLLFSPHLQKQSLSFIHRKGAAPVHYPSTSTPPSILPLPGSRATPTLILHPTLSSAIQHGALNALSLAHGAGRSMSRAKAASYMEGKYKGRESELLSGDIHKE